MSDANPLWGAPRIHGELLKLGIDVGQTTVAKYMARRRQPPSQGWKTFLRNHADGIASMDLFLVPTISFRLLYGLLILRHSRRELLWLGVTAHPSAEWIARQLTEAYGWQQAPRYLVRDRDRIYGHAFLRRLRAMGIRDRPIAARSPWQQSVNRPVAEGVGGRFSPLFDHLVGAQQERFRHQEVKRLGCRKVDDKIELARLLDRDVSRLRPAQNFVDMVGLDTADRQGEAVPEAKTMRLKEKIAKLREEIERLNALNTQMMASEDKQISLTDPDPIQSPHPRGPAA